AKERVRAFVSDGWRRLLELRRTWSEPGAPHPSGRQLAKLSAQGAAGALVAALAGNASGA
ncbi:MAG TPA: hypothetical protein VF333_02810, partial [Pyrinomonadaceae bacterium]